MGARWPPKLSRIKTVPSSDVTIRSRSTQLGSLMGQRNDLWGSLSTYTTIDTCSENQCLKHPVAKQVLYSYVVVWQD